MQICAIINPRAGGWKRLPSLKPHTDLASLVAGWLAPGRPDSIQARYIRGAGEGAKGAAEAIAEGCDTIVAVGGDGTINDVLQGLCATQNEARFGLIPMGTINLLARDLGLPRTDPARAAQLLLHSKERRIDLGRNEQRWFALVAGIGFDGAVTRAVDFQLKKRIGRLAYAVAATQVACKFPRHCLTLTLDGGKPQHFDAYQVLIANGSRYAGRFRLGPDVCLDDGLLDVFVCLRRAPFAGSLASAVVALARDRFHRADGVLHFQARHISAEAECALPIQFDGDYDGQTPTTIHVVPGALRILAP